MHAKSAKHMSIPDINEDKEYPEVAWGIRRFGEKIRPFWINRPRILRDH